MQNVSFFNFILFALVTDVIHMFPSDPPPPTILPYFIKTSRLIVSSWCQWPYQVPSLVWSAVLACS